MLPVERCTPARVLEWSEGVQGGLGDIVSTAADDDRKTLYSETGRGGESNLNGHGMRVTNGGRDDAMMREVLILPPMQHTHSMPMVIRLTRLRLPSRPPSSLQYVQETVE